jgi:hypothetical protein
MRPTSQYVARPCGLFVPLVLALALAGCSSSKLSGPSWNLTGGKGATPIPERSINPNPPQAAGLPAPERQPPIYRGGRDPVSGRAPGWGTPPAGFDNRSSQPPSAQPSSSQPYQSQPPAYNPGAVAPGAPVYSPGGAAMPTAAPGYGPRTVDVRPGQSLASIAADNRVSIASLMQANKLRDAYVIPGQQLVIPSR